MIKVHGFKLSSRLRSSVVLLAFIALALISFAQHSSSFVSKWDQTQTPAEREAITSIKSETIREVTEALASQEMQGRGTAQPGGDRAAQYIADRFAKLGLKPLGDEKSYFQKVSFKETQVLPDSSFKAGKEVLKLGSDFVIAPPYSGEKTVSGYLAFVSFGMMTSVPKRNDLAGLDLKGKIVMILKGPPKNISEEAWDKSEIHSSIIRSLYVVGAKAIVFANAATTKHPYSLLADHLSRRQLKLADEADFPSEAPPFVIVSDEGAEKLFAGSGTTYSEAVAKAEQGEYASRDFNKSVSITIRLKKGKGTSSNVVGLLEGSDTALKEQAVVYSAHYDAYGVGSDGRIFPGAADNALGVGEMISIAEAFTKLPKPPRRSIIFLAATGEEYGLLGTEYWVKNPSWKLKKIAANLNFDGIGTEVYGPVRHVVGFGAEHSELGLVLKEVAMAAGVEVVPDPMPEEKSFYRSDHYVFVKRGVPSLMLLGAPGGEKQAWVGRARTWLLSDYHQPTDIVRPVWNWEGPRTVAGIGLLIGYRISTAEDMPKWLPSSPFNRSRGTTEPPPK